MRKLFEYRVTKYNPQLRNARGIYLKSLEEEWTSYSDVGKVFEGKKLTYQDYIAVEDSYIQAIILFMNCLQIDSLTVESLERYPKSSEHLEKVGCSIQWFNALENNM